MLIETLTFRLADAADEKTFLETDRLVQTEFMNNQTGLLRRTTARGPDGEWLVVVLWNSERDADASRSKAQAHPSAMGFGALLDGETVRMKRYATLD